MIYKSVVIVLFLYYSRAAEEGDPCFKSGSAGICRNLRSCQSAINDIRNRINPQICGFVGQDPIVCCVDGVVTTTARPVATTTPRRQTTTPYVPTVPNYVDNDGQGAGGCEPIPANQTSRKTGQKAWDKCIEYQEQLVYPCTKGMALTGELTRKDLCHHKADQLVVGGVDADRYEFPHMALLGYGDIPNLQWLCGGTVISDRFILTAGHCTSTRETGPVAYVLLGTLKRSDQYDSSNLYRVIQIVKHPEYKPPAKYNDIALLETDRQINLDQFLVPACLDVGDAKDESKALASGWGATEYRGDNANTLQKVILTKFTSAECSNKFPVTRLMKSGVNERTQVCYGDYTRSKDTCQGDSGGPLQVKSKKIYCMYTVIGVTSFGRACGYIGDPGIYTKVAPYVGWIETVVWP